MKGYNKKSNNGNKGNQPKTKRVFHTTSTGKTVEIVGIDPMLLDSIRESIDWPEHPQYSIKIGTSEEWHDLDEKVVKQEVEAGNIDLAQEYQALLDGHKRALVDANALLNTRVTRAILTKGIKVDVENDEDWADTQEFLGVGAGKNKLQRKYDYIVSQVIGIDTDLYDLMEKVMAHTGVSQEHLDTARSMFRDPVDEGKEKNTTGEAAKETGQLGV